MPIPPPAACAPAMPRPARILGPAGPGAQAR